VPSMGTLCSLSVSSDLWFVVMADLAPTDLAARFTVRSAVLKDRSLGRSVVDS